MNSTAPQFFIYSASAGSGKTFTLTKEYLRLCLATNDGNKYREILAITFTNKAAAEMKNRILVTLENIATGKHDNTSTETQKILLKEIGIAPEVLKARAKKVLSNILHNYSDFSISTIDHFTHRLVRTFAADLKLSPIFDVEIDERRLQAEATDKLISKAGTDKDLTKVLNNFVAQRLDDERSWSLEKSVTDVASHINKERSRDYVQKLKELNLQQFLAAKKALDNRLKSVKNALIEMGEKGQALILANAIEPEHFAGGKNGIPIFLRRLANWEVKGLRPSDRLQKYVENNNWVSGKGGESRGIIMSISAELSEIFYNATNLLEEYYSFILLANEVNKEFYSLAVIQEVAACIEEIKTDENIIPLSEFNHMIFEEIKGLPSPYIYERLGERYKSFFIDEFQDTSIMQWQNLLPLINNAMAAGGGYCMLVGDAKQSIYRWRGGEAEQFINLFEGTDKSNLMSVGNREVELYPRTPKTLGDNWRSHKTIVEFNNDLYAAAEGVLTNDAYKEIYRNSSQNAKGKPGGFVQLEILPKLNVDDAAPVYLQRTFEEIHRALDANYRYRDICVLVKKNKYASWLLAKFSENSIPAYSSGALMVNKSKEVAWVIAVLQWHQNPTDKPRKLELLKQSLQNNLVEVTEEEVHGFFDDALKLRMADFIALLNAKMPYVNKVLRESYFLYDICERLFYESGIWADENTFISSFLNEAHNYSTNKEPLVSSFLDFWENHSDGITVEPPENMNQVAVMTIHKAKGLEFPVVIVPFADWGLTKNNFDKTWINLEKPMDIPVALIGGSESTAEIVGGDYAAKTKELIEQTAFDALNVLYVATTRPKEVLIVIGKIPIRKNNVYDVFKEFLAKREIEIGEGIYEFGEYPVKEEMDLPEPLPERKPIVNPWPERVKISTSYPLGWPHKEYNAIARGNQIHDLLAEIGTAADVKTVVAKALRRGRITPEEEKNIAEKLNAVVNHSAVAEFFTDDIQVYNERDIVITKSKNKRPDRVVKTKNNWAVLDYKTGAEEEKHVRQVNDYAELLGGENVQKVLVYINEKVEVKVW